MEWQPARNHACLQVEIYPRKKRSSVKAATSTASKPASVGTSQSPRQTTAQSAATSSPAVVAAPVQKSTVLPWVVAGVAVLVLVGVLLFMNRGSDEPQPTTNSPPITQPPAPDPQLAQRHYERGQNYYHGTGGESQDYTVAFKWFRKAVDMGHAGAQFGLGNMYYKGQEVPQDYKEGVKWFRKAALQGNASGQSGLGFMNSMAKECHRTTRKR